jgi:hypothetical protein
MSEFKIAMIGLFDDEVAEIENDVFSNKITIHQSLKDNPEKFSGTSFLFN